MYILIIYYNIDMRKCMKNVWKMYEKWMKYEQKIMMLWWICIKLASVMCDESQTVQGKWTSCDCESENWTRRRRFQRCQSAKKTRSDKTQRMTLSEITEAPTVMPAPKSIQAPIGCFSKTFVYCQTIATRVWAQSFWSLRARNCTQTTGETKSRLRCMWTLESIMIGWWITTVAGGFASHTQTRKKACFCRRIELFFIFLVI